MSTRLLQNAVVHAASLLGRGFQRHKTPNPNPACAHLIVHVQLVLGCCPSVALLDAAGAAAAAPPAALGAVRPGRLCAEQPVCSNSDDVNTAMCGSG